MFPRLTRNHCRWQQWKNIE